MASAARLGTEPGALPRVRRGGAETSAVSRSARPLSRDARRRSAALPLRGGGGGGLTSPLSDVRPARRWSPGRLSAASPADGGLGERRRRPAAARSGPGHASGAGAGDARSALSTGSLPAAAERKATPHRALGAAPAPGGPRPGRRSGRTVGVVPGGSRGPADAGSGPARRAGAGAPRRKV